MSLALLAQIRFSLEQFGIVEEGICASLLHLFSDSALWNIVFIFSRLFLWVVFKPKKVVSF